MQRQQVIEQLPALRRYARVLTGDAWAADDLVQDTLERACSKWVLWRTGTNLRAWLFTLMHRLYLNQLRSQPTLPPVSIDDIQAEEHLPGVPSMPDDALDLQRCLLRLPAEQRAVLLLVALEGMGYEETARILGVPAGTVMSRLSRARTRLRALMEQAPSGAASPAAQQPSAVSPPLRRLK